MAISAQIAMPAYGDCVNLMAKKIYDEMGNFFSQKFQIEKDPKIYFYSKNEYDKEKGTSGVSSGYSVSDQDSGAFLKRISWDGSLVSFTRYEIPVIYQGNFYILQSESRLDKKCMKRVDKFKVFSSNGVLLFKQGVKRESELSINVLDIVAYSVHTLLKLENGNCNRLYYTTANGSKIDI